jgi:hypothetical protein
VDWNDTGQDTYMWRVLTSVKRNLCVLQNAEGFLTRRETIRFSRWTMRRGVS